MLSSPRPLSSPLAPLRVAILDRQDIMSKPRTGLSQVSMIFAYVPFDLIRDLEWDR